MLFFRFKGEYFSFDDAKISATCTIFPYIQVKCLVSAEILTKIAPIDEKTANFGLAVGEKSVELGWKLVAFFQFEDFVDGDAEDA